MSKVDQLVGMMLRGATLAELVQFEIDRKVDTWSHHEALRQFRIEIADEQDRAEAESALTSLLERHGARSVLDLAVLDDGVELDRAMSLLARAARSSKLSRIRAQQSLAEAAERCP